MAALKNDGTVPYGSKVLAIGPLAGGLGAGSVNYVADNIELTRSTGAILRTNQLGEPSGRVLFKNDVDTFTATLQLATPTTNPPAPGWETTVVFDGATGGYGVFAGEVFYVDKVGESWTKDGETKVNVTFAELLSA